MPSAGSSVGGHEVGLHGGDSPLAPPNFNIEIGGRGGAAVFRKMPARLAGVYFANTGGEFPSSIVIFVLGHIPTPFCHRLLLQFGPL